MDNRNQCFGERSGDQSGDWSGDGSGDRSGDKSYDWSGGRLYDLKKREVGRK